MNNTRWREGRRLITWVVCFICATGVSCGTRDASSDVPIPRELRMTTLPPYVIEPPDILIITTMNVVPKPPYQVQPMDALFIQVTGTIKEKEIWGLYPIEPGGTINLGLGYGTVQVAGMTIEAAEKAVKEHLGKILKEPTVKVSLGQARARQQIQGDHLVRQDGTIGMGVYGSVYVTGMTIDQARQTIETHLSQFLLKPEISLDVYSYNSKWYYIIQDRAGWGQTVMRFPITGRDTVLDALTNMGGTWMMSSNKHLWLARPNGQNPKEMQLFPINWPALTQGGSPETNYQLLPGDRLYVRANPLNTLSMRIMQVIRPIEMTMGFGMLGFAATGEGNSVIRSIQTGASTSGFFR